MSRIVALLLCSVLLAACGTEERVDAPIDPDATTLVIAHGTVGRVGALNIGVSGVTVDDYVDDAGASRRGVVAGLHLFLASEPPSSERRQVHAGQRLEVLGHSVFVEQVSENGALSRLLSGGAPGASGGRVHLRVKASR